MRSELAFIYKTATVFPRFAFQVLFYFTIQVIPSKFHATSEMETVSVPIYSPVEYVTVAFLVPSDIAFCNESGTVGIELVQDCPVIVYTFQHTVDAIESFQSIRSRYITAHTNLQAVAPVLRINTGQHVNGRLCIFISVHIDSGMPSCVLCFV